jgi:hypothetical protein
MSLADYYVFDIETVPLPDEELRQAIPAFNEEEVKVGNLKPENAAAKIEKARLEHANRILEKAALDPLTGRVAAVGILGPAATGTVRTLFDPDEKKLINWFFSEYVRTGESRWIGFNIAGFDIPFLLRRAWKLGIKPPYHALLKGRYLSSFLIDLAEVWRCSTHERDFPSLSRLAEFLGVGSKLGSGAGFAHLLYSDEKAAREYLERDLYLTWAVAVRLGVIDQRPEAKKAPTVPVPEPEPEIIFY